MRAISSVVMSDSQKAITHAAGGLSQFGVVAGLTFFSSLFGILARPVGILAAFWPANPLLLGFMVRHRKYSTPLGWSGAFVGYVVSDLITEGDWFVTGWLTLANMVGAGTGVFLFSRLSEEDRRLGRPIAVLYLFVVSLIAAVAASLIGGGAVSFLFGKDWMSGFAFWFTTELVNDLLLVPVVLACPPIWDSLQKLILTARFSRKTFFAGIPCLSLLGALLITQIVGGPGAIAFVVPALLWCALSYSKFSTSILTLLTCTWMMVASSAGLIEFLPVSADELRETMSIRLGIAFLALGPLTAASINETRNELVARLNHAVNHDFLTDTLARRALLNAGAKLVEIPGRQTLIPSVLMMDIDHFKHVNDEFGHAGGDEVLIRFARIVSAVLRKGDLFGRMGGEEFAVILPKATRENAVNIAERIRGQVESSSVFLSDGRSLQVTVSIGVATWESDAPPVLTKLLDLADESLYRAKTGGRNRVDSSVRCLQG